MIILEDSVFFNLTRWIHIMEKLLQSVLCLVLFYYRPAYTELNLVGLVRVFALLHIICKILFVESFVWKNHNAAAQPEIVQYMHNTSILIQCYEVFKQMCQGGVRSGYKILSLEDKQILPIYTLVQHLWVKQLFSHFAQIKNLNVKF